MKKSALFLLWVGAAISISEIFTGGLLAPLGLVKGLAAIIAGHLIGTGLLALGGLVSFSRRANAMETVTFSLGREGGKLVALCNVVQLAGWTIIMIVQGGSAIKSLFPGLPFAPLSLGLGLMVLLWALGFGSPVQWINSIVVILLSALCVILLWETAGKAQGPVLSASMSFALALELSIAMPISWLPLVGDYSSQSSDRVGAALMPFAGYFLGSVFMYSLGLFIRIKTGTDFFVMIAASRFRFIACAVILFSTLTTAFLDLYSAAVSSQQFVKTRNTRLPILALGLFTALASAVFPAERYGDFLTNFLTLIGMVFVPVYGIVFIDFFAKRREYPSKINLPALMAALIAMGVYRLCTIRNIGIPSLVSLAVLCGIYIPIIRIQIRRNP
ncbi:cytosine permease [Treponema primitia]|uniref:cytosine permease n=1 Tax=Treponema primitia TaxID=88058 RepID=UPI00398173D1